MPVDLHSHSTASDGSHSPHELALTFNMNGIKIAALTDHDTMGGGEEFLQTASEIGLCATVGIEFSTVYRGMEVHLLGYGLPVDDPRVIEFMVNHHSYLKERMKETMSKLKECGFDISIEKVYEISKGNPPMPSHIIRELHYQGYINNMKDILGFFYEYLAFGARAWVDHETRIEDPLKIMLDVGAIPIVAHPYKFPDTSWLEELLDLGAKGFELYYPEHTGQVFDDLQEIAGQRDCIVTGGSDYHGAFSERNILDVKMPLEVGVKLFEAIGQEVPVDIIVTSGGEE